MIFFAAEIIFDVAVPLNIVKSRLKCCLVIRFHFFLLSFLHVGFRSIWVKDWTSFLVTRNFYSLLNLRLHDARLK